MDLGTYNNICVIYRDRHILPMPASILIHNASTMKNWWNCIFSFSKYAVPSINILKCVANLIAQWYENMQGTFYMVVMFYYFLRHL